MDCSICFKPFPIQEIAEHADSCASWHVESVGETITIDESNLFDNNEFGIGDCEPGQTFGDCEPGQTFVSLIKELQNNLEPGDPVCINVRRKTLWEDFTKERKKRVKPQQKLKVLFLGEPAIDDGGPRREFFSGKVLLF